jgi:uncharacterized protein DUF3631
VSCALTAADIPWVAANAGPTPACVAETTAGLLNDIEVYLRDYVVFSKHQAVATALWVFHTHAVDYADCTPYLNIRSATKRAGKTRLLEVLEPLVARPWLTGRTTAAALVRKVDATRPTLLLDESDAAFHGEPDYAEALRGLLNSGYRTSGRATVCVGVGPSIIAKDFSTFCAKAIAGIGMLPDTVADRSIPILLRRRKPGEHIERWRERDGRAVAQPLYDRLAQWSPSASALRTARPAVPDVLSDRAMDCWEPLLAIADFAGGEWPRLARESAIVLAGHPTEEDDSVAVQMLGDIRQIFDDAGESALPSKAIREQLCEMENRPWAEWGKQRKPITGHGVARLLRDFEVVPAGNLRFGDKVAAGYRRASFEDAWARYLPAAELPPAAVPLSHSLLRNSSNDDGAQPTVFIPNTPEPVTNAKTAGLSNNDGPSYEVTNEEAENGGAHEVAVRPAVSGDDWEAL